MKSENLDKQKPKQVEPEVPVYKSRVLVLLFPTFSPVCLLLISDSFAYEAVLSLQSNASVKKKAKAKKHLLLSKKLLNCQLHLADDGFSVIGGYSMHLILCNGLLSG